LHGDNTRATHRLRRAGGRNECARYAPGVAPPQVGALEFGILGPLEIRCADGVIELRREKERLLLAMLLLHTGDVVTLDHLAAGLWEEADAPRPPATLRVHISRLRQALAAAGASGDELVVTSPRGYTLNVPPEAIDAARFDELVAEGRALLPDDPHAAAQRFARGLALWRGPVLSDLMMSPVNEPELVRLTEARAAAIEDRVDADLRCGRDAELVGELEQLVTEYPLRERLWGQLMVALYRGGRQADALRKFEEVRRLLGDELGIVPSPDLQAIERAILDHDPALAPPPAIGREASAAPRRERLARRVPGRLVPDDGEPFTGRRAQLDALLDAWKACASGERRVVLLSGEAGIGKTRLAAELATRVDGDGGVVLFGRCDEDVGVPFQPFVEALEHVLQAEPSAAELGRYAGELARLVPDLAQRVGGLEPPLQADPETELYRLFDAVVSWLGAMAGERGVVFVLDDLHWAAKPTLLLLRALARAGGRERVLIVGTYRDTDIEATHPLSATLADLRREPCVTRVALSGLEPSEVEEMVARAGGDANDRAAGELARVLQAETDGNPFFVQEILRSLIESGVALDAGSADSHEIPASVREVVGRRLGRLGADANQVLSWGSVLGEVIDFEVVVAVSELDDEAVLDALDEATTAALLRETSAGTYEFTHAIVRATLYEELSGARRARRHRQVGEALVALGSKDIVALAHHFWLAGGADVRAVDYAAAAGADAVRQLAFDRAAAFYAQALEAAARAGVPAERRCELLIELGSAQRLAAMPAFRETLLEASALAQEIGNARLLAKAVLTNNRGFPSAAGVLDQERVAFIEAAVASFDAADSATRARLLSLLALELTWRDPNFRRLELADEAVAMARRRGDDACLLEVSIIAQVACTVPDRVPALVEDLPALVELAERVGDAQQLARVCIGGAAHWIEMGALDEADRLLQRVAQLAEDLESPLFRLMDAHQRCRGLTITGTGDEIEQAALAALKIGEDAGQPDIAAWFVPELFAARWSQGRLGETLPLIRNVVELTPGLAVWPATLALAHLALGERDEAVRLVNELMTDAASVFPRDLVWMTGHSVLAEAVAAVGTPEQAAQEYALLAPYAGRIPCVFNVARPGVNHWLGALAAHANRAEEAERHFAAAYEQHGQLGAPVWLARTQLEWGRRLATAGDTERARVLLTRARAGAARIGATDIALRADELLDDAR